MTGAVDPASEQSLAGEAWRRDPRVAEAKRLLTEALLQHRQRLSEVRPPQPQHVGRYEQLLAELADVRGAAPFFPYLGSGLGNGPWVELADGSVKLDFISGIGVHGLGHSDARMLEAAIDGALEDVLMQGNLQQHPPSLWFCQRLLNLARHAGAPMSHCLLTTSGAMANENALKIVLHARHPADRVLCFEHCFAGRSLATAALTDRSTYRQSLPLALAVDYVPFYDPQRPAESTANAVQVLERLLARYPGRYAALWAEPVTGEGGYYPASAVFYRQVAEVLRGAGVLIVFDEIQTFARLSHPYAIGHFGIGDLADVVTVGKITQVCATLFRSELKPRAPILSQTFTGSSASITGGLAVLAALEATGCFGSDGSNMRRATYFAAALDRLSQKYPGAVRGPYGAGMMVALTPGNGRPETARAYVDQLFAAGLMGFVCGSDPTRLRFLPPPAVTTEAHIDRAVEILEQVIRQQGALPA